MTLTNKHTFLLYQNIIKTRIMTPEEIVIKARKMDRCDDEVFIGKFSENNRKYSVYLTDKFCMNRHRFHVIVDGSMGRYTSSFNKEFFEETERLFAERECITEIL